MPRGKTRRATKSAQDVAAESTDEATSRKQAQLDPADEPAPSAAPPALSAAPYGIDYFTSTISRVLPPTTVTVDSLAVDLEAMGDARAVLANIPVKHHNEKEARRCHLEEQFPVWAFQLSQGFGILLYGFGSKRHLLDSFLRSRPEDHAVLSVDGRAPGLTAHQVLVRVAHTMGRASMQQLRSQHDETLLADMRASVKPERHLVLGIHNIEGLAEPCAQSLLSEVAGLPNVQVIATMDHVDTPLLWDKETAARFNWLWHDATTMAPYAEEVKGFESVLEGRREGSAIAAATRVLQSLVPNAQKVYRVLLDAIVDTEDASTEMRFADLFKTCRDGFLVQNEITLRAHLTEFRDHSLVVSRRGADGVEYIGIPYEYEAVLKLYEQIENQLG